MVSKLPHELRKYARNSLHLSRILEDTKRATKDIDAASIFSGEDLELCVFNSIDNERLNSMLSEKPVMMVFGRSSVTCAHFVNNFLDCDLLPTTGGQWRWVRILFGRVGHVSLTVGMEFEVMDSLRAHEKPWSTVPEEDLLRPPGEDLNSEHVAILEIERCHTILRDGLQIIIPPELDPWRPQDIDCLRHVVHNGLKAFVPLLVYTIESTVFTEKDIKRLEEIRELFPESPVFFVVNVMSVPSHPKEQSQGVNNPTVTCRRRGPSSTELTESEQHALEQHEKELQSAQKGSESLDDNLLKTDSLYVSRLVDLGYLSEDEANGHSRCTHLERYCRNSVIADGLGQLDLLLRFVRGVLRTHLVTAATLLNQVHTEVLGKFILCAFDMAREIQITPRRIKYALEKEGELYRSLMKMASEQQAEITQLITETLESMREQLIEDATRHVYRGSGVGRDHEANSRAARLAAEEIQRLVLSRLTHAVARQLMCSMGCMQDSVVGTLQRTLCSLERQDRTFSESITSSDNDNDFDNDTDNSVQDSSESFHEINSVECLLSGNNSSHHQLASDALKQILSAAYAVQLYPTTPSSLFFGLFERLRHLLHGVQLPWATPPRLDAAWKRRVASDMLDTLSPARLARSISSQFREKVRFSHENFQAALRSLESHYTGRLERTEEQRVAIRKFHAPRLARLALESYSMADVVRFGMPQLGKEIGRGQYGVVFSCESWGGAGPCAVKSVVPPDDKHWNDLAMEFYYTRSISEHPRIVRLRGSVVDHSYGGGSSVAVLLVMDRLNRDLYGGLRDGLVWKVRLQIAVDVVEGIRYLHSQGLVHRDIKLKNVLLDCDNRAKLTDLGFCIPEAMMSGSIVGTPVHMAPELLSGQYDSSVDVYAFGILFWYICAGSVRLPFRFDKFHNKEQLWNSVRKGGRPERLTQFDDDCWQLMEQCWSGEPSARPLLGSVQLQLEAIMERYTIGTPVSVDSSCTGSVWSSNCNG